MRIVDDRFRLSPTDLSHFLGCRHLTSLDIRSEKGELDRPEPFSPLINELIDKGKQHETTYLAHLKAQGLKVVELEEDAGSQATIDAMEAGADVIYQAPLRNDTWFGFADFLIKVPTKSDRWDWSYEVQDTKLAKETRGGTIVQLCVYSYLVGEIQGRPPEHMHVVAPGRNYAPETHRCDDYGAYFRLIAGGLRDFANAPSETYPDLVSHCDYCNWWAVCETRRRGDDHLCYVAGLGGSQLATLRDMDINTLEALAEAPSIEKPDRGSRETLLKLQEQARIQLWGRESGEPIHEIITPLDEQHGFRLLPEPTPDDIFLDFEGNHFAEHGVREYLTGYVTLDGEAMQYTPLWADTQAKEQQAFEQFVDFALSVRERNPNAHIYHFGAYEPVALKRQMGWFATREVELDRLLRGETFVDLHRVVKSSLIASVENYSIKNLEPHFGYERTQNLREATRSRRAIEVALEIGTLDDSVVDHIARVEVYNREDCESTYRLQQWLESLRAQEVANGANIPRPQVSDGEAPEEIGDLDRRLQDLRDRLLVDVPEEPSERSTEEQARFLLAHMMEFHRRENKAAWWENYRLRDLPNEDYLGERRAVAELEFIEVLDHKAAPLQRYRFIKQDVDARVDDEVKDNEGNKIGTVTALDLGNSFIDIKKRKDTAGTHPTHAYFHKVIGADAMRESLVRFGEHVISNGLAMASPYASAVRLLLRSAPNGETDSDSLMFTTEGVLQAAKRLITDMEGQVLAIQGPPGTGKTFTGAQMICELIEVGKSVGVTAVSHKVILNLLEKAAEEAVSRGLDTRIVHKPKSGEKEYEGDSAISYEKKDPKILEGLADGSIAVQGGTTWLWSKPEFAEQQLDVLIVDEAGQMALANVLAVAPAAKTLVLLGDPQQLEQPLQSSHPEGSDVPALTHWLGARNTMPEDRGLFLDVTWRLHPDICRFTSEVYYEERLTAKPGLESQSIKGEDQPLSAGLGFLPVEHTGNTARSTEEAEAAKHVVENLLDGKRKWTDSAQVQRPLEASDILLVAPYNAQVALLEEMLPMLAGQIGTVDKFQGQEAPIVIYSMTSSSPADAPRGMEFLYNPNRFNVATSRAKALFILIGSPLLLDPECKTPAQMRMANGVCRFRELARHYDQQAFSN